MDHKKNSRRRRRNLSLHCQEWGDSVHLAGRYLRDEDIKQIAKALMEPTTKVQNITLDNSFIQFSGAITIAKALETNQI